MDTRLGGALGVSRREDMSTHAERARGEKEARLSARVSKGESTFAIKRVKSFFSLSPPGETLFFHEVFQGQLLARLIKSASTLGQ